MWVEGSRCKVQGEGKYTESFQINAEVRQGNGLSTLGFKIRDQREGMKYQFMW